MRSVSFPELRRALELVGELRTLPRGSQQQRAHFLGGLASLVGAQVTILIDVTGHETGETMMRGVTDLGWQGERERGAFLSYLHSPWVAPDPSLPLLAEVPGGTFARTRQDLLPDRDWYRSEHVQEQRRAAGVDHFVAACHRRGERAQALTLHRPWGDRPFRERERLLLETLFGVAAPLLASPVALSPRQAAVLEALCRGLSEKDIARELGISPHTVHVHVKVLHRRFEAQSRGELLMKAMSG